jgi:hypothetical protein
MSDSSFIFKNSVINNASPTFCLLGNRDIQDKINGMLEVTAMEVESKLLP